MSHAGAGTSVRPPHVNHTWLKPNAACDLRMARPDITNAPLHMAYTVPTNKTCPTHAILAQASSARPNPAAREPQGTLSQMSKSKRRLDETLLGGRAAILAFRIHRD